MKRIITGIILYVLLPASFAVAQHKVNIVPINYLLLGSPGSFSISSSSFSHNQPLDSKYTLYGNNISPQLSWENAPAGTVLFDLKVTDSDAADFLHWKVQLPKTTTSLNENAGASGGGNLPTGSIRYDNDFYGSGSADGTDYDGPEPPLDLGVHHYDFTLSALDGSETVIQSVTITGIFEAIGDCNGEWEGTAYLDNCETCVDGNTGETPCDRDCNGDWGGTATTDDCGVCDDNPANDNETCTQDCNDVWGGTATTDDCGVCDDNPAKDNETCTQDCNDVQGGTAYWDRCEDCVGGDTGEISCDYMSDRAGIEKNVFLTIDTEACFNTTVDGLALLQVQWFNVRSPLSLIA